MLQPWLNQKHDWPFSPLSSVPLSPRNAPPPLPTGQRLAFGIGLDSSFGFRRGRERDRALSHAVIP
jgi:hypothetical protein